MADLLETIYVRIQGPVATRAVSGSLALAAQHEVKLLAAPGGPNLAIQLDLGLPAWSCQAVRRFRCSNWRGAPHTHQRGAQLSMMAVLLALLRI